MFGYAGSGLAGYDFGLMDTFELGPFFAIIDFYAKNTFFEFLKDLAYF